MDKTGRFVVVVPPVSRCFRAKMSPKRSSYLATLEYLICFPRAQLGLLGEPNIPTNYLKYIILSYVQKEQFQSQCPRALRDLARRCHHVLSLLQVINFVSTDNLKCNIVLCSKQERFQQQYPPSLPFLALRCHQNDFHTFHHHSIRLIFRGLN